MDFGKRIGDVQGELKEQNLDGWLLYDFRGSNDLACELLQISKDSILSRRFFYWIPKYGDPIKLVHRIENPISHLPGQTQFYSTWKELEENLQDLLNGSRTVAMEYSPRNAIPYVSKVDGGTLEIVRSFGVDIASSADLIQKYTSVWNEHQWESHLKATDLLDQTVAKAWELISDHLKNGHSITEYDVQQFILGQFSIHSCVTHDPPIVAVNNHSSDPHYIPTEEKNSQIQPGDFILIDLWCKEDLSKAVYGDISRVGVASSRPTDRQLEIFHIVKQARDVATQLVKDRFAAGQKLCGWEIDQAARDVITQAGYGEYFIHRTGHNIGESSHGNGANIDNFETQDQRQILPGTCFSIEPGIYLPNEFGVRLEYDVYVHPDGKVQVTGGIQNEIVCLN